MCKEGELVMFTKRWMDDDICCEMDGMIHNSYDGGWRIQEAPSIVSRANILTSLSIWWPILNPPCSPTQVSISYSSWLQHHWARQETHSFSDLFHNIIVFQ